MHLKKSFYLNIGNYISYLKNSGNITYSGCFQPVDKLNKSTVEMLC